MAILDIVTEAGDYSAFINEIPSETLVTLQDILTETNSSAGTKIMETVSNNNNIIIIED